MGHQAIPATVDGLTPEWITEALTADGALDGGRVTSLAVEPIGVGIGVMALLYRLTLDYEGDSGPPTLVAKLASRHEQTRQVARGYRFYEREVAIYRELADELRLNPPHPYAALHDVESDDFVVLMRDLGDHRVCSQVEGCSVDDAGRVVDALAAHHAEWWGSPRLEALPYIQTPAEPPYPQFHAQSTKEAWTVCRQTFGDVVPPSLHPVAERWADIGPSMMEDTVNYPWTFAHGDVRLDNVFFDDAGSSLSIVDWQIGFRTAGAFDVAYFLGQSLTVDDRRTHGDSILRRYHHGLVERGVADYSWDDFVADYGRSLMFSFCYPLTAGASLDLVNDRAVELVASMFERVSTAIVDADATRYLPN
jgi:hypothetical protein